MTRTIRQVLMSFLIAMVLLAAFNSASLVTWAYDLRVGLLSDAISFIAENWHDMMQEYGPARITDTLRDWFQEIIDT